MPFAIRIKAPLKPISYNHGFSMRKPMGEKMVRTGCKLWDAEANSFGVARTRLGEATHRSFRPYHRHKMIVYFFPNGSGQFSILS
jgi:hypothetical protein